VFLGADLNGVIRDTYPLNSPGVTCHLGLAHRRLSILDLSPRGHQPMADAAQRHWIVYNGEVYNYRELRDSLRTTGYCFESNTDTEVILAAYDAWGIGCLDRFNGMFAFALWDEPARRLYLARDRYGVKPLYYFTGDGVFAFASEIKALLALDLVPCEPNPAIVYDFLSLKLADHTSETFYHGIHAVPAAHYLLFEPGRSPRLQRWWDVTVNPEIRAGQQEAQRAASDFREILTDSVRLRLRSDVPLGTCLSGGLDSSSIVMLVSEIMQRECGVDRAALGDRQRTFSACYEDLRFDERRFGDEIVRRSGAANHQVFPDGDQLWRDLDRLLWYMDEPFHSTSQYSQWNVFRLVREQGVTVTLDGQGADELLAGYPGYYGSYFSTLLRQRELSLLSKELRAALAMRGRGRGIGGLALRLAYGAFPASTAAVGRELAQAILAPLLPEGRAWSWIRPEWHQRFGERRRQWLVQQHASYSRFGQRLYDDVFRFSLPSLLRYEDRNSMAFSIESRTPLLDYRLGELVFGLPASLKLRGGWTKWLLRQAMDQTLPPSVQWRTDKMGFVTPEGHWIRQAADRIRDLLAGPLAIDEYVDTERLRSGHRALIRDTSPRAYYTDIFRWLVVERWLQLVRARAARRRNASPWANGSQP
jgi:asparagine synthase (glutamine-hydrolysing)